MIITVLCAVAFVVIAACLLLHGMRGRRGMVWTMRMDEDQ